MLPKVKVERPNLPVVMDHCLWDERTRKTASELGAAGLLPKPIDFSLLHQEIDRARSGRVALQRGEQLQKSEPTVMRLGGGRAKRPDLIIDDKLRRLHLQVAKAHKRLSLNRLREEQVKRHPSNFPLPH